VTASCGPTSLSWMGGSRKIPPSPTTWGSSLDRRWTRQLLPEDQLPKVRKRATRRSEAVTLPQIGRQPDRHSPGITLTNLQKFI
jgi:hypothetical protein